MKFTFVTFAGLLAVALAFFAVEAQATVLGLAWAADNRWAPALAKNPNTKFYHHWEMRNVPELSRAGISYVPTYWGDKKAYNWPATKALFGKYRYKRALFVNEPDIPSQSDYTPARAAGAFMREMVPLRQKYGTKLSSPQICYNVDWLASWLRIMKQKGQSPDFLAVHYYGGWNSVGQLKSYISGIHNRWPHYKIWITEFGVTSASRPSAAQVKQFFVDSVNWFGSQDYVEAVFPFGIWAQAPDSYGSQQNAAFWDNGALRTLGEYWAHVNPAKRSLLEQEPASNHRAIRRHHALIERIIAREPSPEEEKWDDVHPSNATDCDESNPRSNCAYLKEFLARPLDGPEDESKLHDDDVVDDDNEPSTPAVLPELTPEQLDALEAALEAKEADAAKAKAVEASKAFEVTENIQQVA